MSLSDKISNAVTWVLFAYLIFSVFIQHKQNLKNTTTHVDHQNEIKTAGPFLNQTGQVAEPGWSRHYLREFDHEKIYPVWFGLNFLKQLRFKKFEFYSFNFDSKLAILAIANLGYGSSAFVNVYDFETKTVKQYQEKMIVLLDKNFPEMPPSPYNCDKSEYNFTKNEFKINIKKEKTNLNTVCETIIDIKIGNEFVAHFKNMRNIENEDFFEMLSIYDNNKYFLYNLKTYDNACEGLLRMNGQESIIKKSNCMAAINYDRGVFLYKTNWVWISAYGKDKEGNNLAFNFGGGLAKTGATVEDHFKKNGKIHKINPVIVDLDAANDLKTLAIVTNPDFEQDRHLADITFTPFSKTELKENLLVVVSHLQYIYGSFSGKLIDGEGNVTLFENVLGFVELGRFKW